MPTDGWKWGDLLTDRSAGGSEYVERVEHVELVRHAVASGTYHVDSLEIADRLLDSGVLDDAEPG